MKNFDEWNKLKKNIDDNKKNNLEIRNGEIWWCSLGLNIGDEENGKNKNFDRPVLIFHKFNNRVCLVLPLTSKVGHPKFYFKISYNRQTGFLIMSQIRLISVKRLQRIIARLSVDQFRLVKNRFVEIIR